jgi:hypothetical protein
MAPSLGSGLTRLSPIASEHTAQRDAPIAASRSFVATRSPFSRNVVAFDLRVQQRSRRVDRRHPCGHARNAQSGSSAELSAQDRPAKSRVRRVRVGFWSGGIPPHDNGRSERFQNFGVFGGSLINLQMGRRLHHPLGSHVFRHSHARIASSGHESATLVIPPCNSSGIVAHTSLMVFC